MMSLWRRFFMKESLVKKNNQYKRLIRKIRVLKEGSNYGEISDSKVDCSKRKGKKI